MSKRFLVVQTRQNKDKDTDDDLLYLTLFRLPNKMKNGNLWYPSNEKRVVVTCFNKVKKPEEYQKFLNVRPGALVDVNFGMSEFNEKPYVSEVRLVEGSFTYSDDILFI